MERRPLTEEELKYFKLCGFDFDRTTESYLFEGYSIAKIDNDCFEIERISFEYVPYDSDYDYEGNMNQGEYFDKTTSKVFTFKDLQKWRREIVSYS